MVLKLIPSNVEITEEVVQEYINGADAGLALLAAGRSQFHTDQHWQESARANVEYLKRFVEQEWMQGRDMARFHDAIAQYGAI